MSSPQAIVQQFIDRVNIAVKNGKADPYELLSPDVLVTVIGFTPLSGNYHGRDQVQYVLGATLVDRFQEASVEMTEVIGSGARFAALGIISGVSTTGNDYNKARDTGGFVFEVIDGKITEIIAYPDTTLIETALYDNKYVETVRG